MTSSAGRAPVLVIGAGISGLACARALRAAGVAARVVERGHVVGGRMASRRLEGRVVDLGAAFFTAELESPFGAIVRDWVDRGLARPWTDTLSVSEPGRPLVPKSGPLRYAAPGGLRSLVTDLAEGLEVEFEHPVTALPEAEPEPEPAPGAGVDYSAVVLAMPDPQALRLLSAGGPVAGGSLASRLERGHDWAPTISVALGWAEPQWSAELHGVFVNDSPVLSFVADDGDRRGDGAAVLVAHSSAELAREHLENPDSAIAPITDAVRALLGIDTAPNWSYAHRWTFARTLVGHPEPFLLEDGLGGSIGICGDGWGGTSSVGTAWTSGDAVGRELAARLA